jgi:molybdopterin molybdotransferase
LISFDEAVGLTCAAARPLGTQRVPLGASAGRVLAAPVIARLESPRFHVSAMDGYALRDADVSVAPVSLRVIGESFPGAEARGEIGAGECVRIFTGAPAPAGADRVMIQELVRREAEFIHIDAAPTGGTHLRHRGSDFQAGETLLEAGRRLDPRAMVAAAAADRAELEVFRRPRVAVLSTGDELAEPGRAAETAGAVPESVSFGIAALASQWGAEFIGSRRLTDELGTLREAASTALRQADLVVVTGGASVGERDFAKPMFETAGLELIFSKVAIKPGKPVWLGQARGTLVLGLPGNPTSAMVTARLFLAPLLVGLGGQKPSQALVWRKAVCATDLAEVGDRETFSRGRWVGEAVELHPHQDSGAQRALVECDVLVRRPPAGAAEAAGAVVEVLDW